MQFSVQEAISQSTNQFKTLYIYKIENNNISIFF